MNKEATAAKTAATRLITPEATGNMLGVTVGTLNVWRCHNRHPLPYVRIGRRIMYVAAGVEQFIAAQPAVGGGAAAE